MTHGTQLVAHGILSGEIQKSNGDLAAIFLKYFWRRNFDLAVCSFYFLTKSFSESFDFSGKSDRDRAFRFCSDFVLFDSVFVTVSFRFRSRSVSTVYHRDRDHPSQFIGRPYYRPSISETMAIRISDCDSLTVQL